MKKLKRFLKKSYVTTLREIKETKAMMKIFFTKEKELYPEAFKQLTDILKITVLVPVLLLPGSAVVLTLMQIVARFFKMSIFPSKQRLRKKSP